MRSLLGWFAIATLMLGGGARASFAQDALVINSTYVSASRDPGQPLGAAPLELQRPLAGGGRYAVGAADVLDLVTGRVTPFPTGAVAIAVDPARPRVFLKENCDLVRDVCDVFTRDIVTGRGVWLTTAAASSSNVLELSPVAKYAVDADVLFVNRAIFGPPFPLGDLAIQAVNASSGVPVSPLLQVRRGSWDVLPDASLLFVGNRLFGHTGIDAIAVASGQVVASSADSSSLLEWQPTLGALVSLSPNLHVYDRALRLVASRSAVGGCGISFRVSAHTGRVYLLIGGGDSTIGPIPHQLQIFSPTNGEWTAVDIDRKAGLSYQACLSMAVLTAPGSPRNLRSSVIGRDVALAWENIGGASGFVLDVGFAPGRSDAQVYLGPNSHASFPNVPPGTYYLRLRGGNEFGGGRASNEIQVIVP